MSAGESVSTGLERTVRYAGEGVSEALPVPPIPEIIPPTQQDSSPVQLVDYIPGSQNPNDIPGTTSSIEHINSGIDEINAVVNELLDVFMEDFATDLQFILSTVNELKAKILGGIDNDLEPMCAMCVKLAGKLYSQINDDLSEIYGRFLDMGYAIPTQEEIA